MFSTVILQIYTFQLHTLTWWKEEEAAILFAQVARRVLAAREASTENVAMKTRDSLSAEHVILLVSGSDTGT